MLFLILATGAFSVQLYNLIVQNFNLNKNLAKITTKLEPLKKENSHLVSEIDYFQKPERLASEVRKSGYVAPGEKMFVIVPQQR